VPVRRPEVALIAAVAQENRVIGKDNDLPWHIPEDLARFKKLTTGHPLIMGRRTFESVLHQFDGPLPDRRMIILTTGEGWSAYPDVETYGSIPAALEEIRDESLVYIGGGAGVYQQFLPMADRLELTLVEGAYDGDTYFPAYEHLIGWAFERTRTKPRNGYRFDTYERIYPPRDT
jgi:dihydrofolate reductase